MVDTEDSLQSQLEALNQAWSQAWIDRDAEYVDAAMTPDFTYVAPNGQVLDRAMMMRIIKSPGYRLDSGSRTEVSVLPIGARAAAVISRWRGEGSYEGSSFRDDHRVTTIFVRLDSGWRVAMEHCCSIAPAG